MHLIIKVNKTTQTVYFIGEISFDLNSLKKILIAYNLHQAIKDVWKATRNLIIVKTVMKSPLSK